VAGDSTDVLDINKYGHATGAGVDAETVQNEIARLMNEARELRSQISQLKERFHAELENLWTRYHELIKAVAERVLRLSDMFKTSVGNVVDALVEKGVLTSDEGRDVLRIAEGMRPRGVPRRVPATPPEDRGREVVVEMARARVREDLRSMLREEPAPLAKIAQTLQSAGKTAARPVQFTCQFCNEQHSVLERTVVEMCSYCHAHLNYLTEQEAFKHHGAVFRRLLSAFLSRERPRAAAARAAAK
jgi:hypothetical protein